MCIRDRPSDELAKKYADMMGELDNLKKTQEKAYLKQYNACLLYTSDAADDLLCVDLGGRRIIKKKKTKKKQKHNTNITLTHEETNQTIQQTTSNHYRTTA